MTVAAPRTPDDEVAPTTGAVVDLGDASAHYPAIAGAKGAALARATSAGLPVLPGFVVTTAASHDATLSAGVVDELRPWWSELSRDGNRPLVVRSSSTAEDGAATSMAGLFTSVLGVRSWVDFLSAVDTVLGSAGGPGISPAPMAVLVQPLLAARVGGVLFGADPVTGRTDRIVVAATAGGPDALVSGAVTGSHYVLTRRGRVLEAENPVPELERRELRALVALAADVAKVFGASQDVEWAFGDGGELHLLQARPITTLRSERSGSGPLWGPGPVAETFPDPLCPLEEDLWVDPLREGLREALALTAIAPRRRLRASALVTTVGGRVAADLSLLGTGPRRRSVLARLDPRPPARRLWASWRVGRLRAVLPAFGADLVVEVDRQLSAIPPIVELTDDVLVDLLHRSHRALVALHGLEVLAGQLADPHGTVPTAASVALEVVAGCRARGVADDEVIPSHPVVLTLAPPRIGPAGKLPPVPESLAAGGRHPDDDEPGDLREALRLRARWVQELTARSAWALGRRLARRGVLTSAEAIRLCRLREIRSLAAGVIPTDLDRRQEEPAAPLPAAFRLSTSGRVVPVAPDRRGDGAGRGAGGGRRQGTVHHLTAGDPPLGAVLVVTTLDPGLAPLLPGLSAVVAETGSVLSHLAILARELGVPTVVGFPDARRRLPPGALVVVDGTTGEVVVEDTDTPTDTLTTRRGLR